MSSGTDVDAPSMEVGATVAGVDPVRLTAEWGSPLYVYDAGVLRARAVAVILGPTSNKMRLGFSHNVLTPLEKSTVLRRW